MHLKKLWISNYKNLKDFTITFNQQTFYDIIIGKNGSGKSNLFEAIIEIFESLRDNSSSAYDFALEYSVKASELKIEFKKGKLNYNGEEVGNIQNSLLPDNILIYYSGHNKRISDLITSYEDKYRVSIKSYEPKDIRFLLGINEGHKNILLLILLLLGDQNESYNNIVSKLNLDTLNSEIKFVLKKPFYYEKKLDAWDETTKFWNIKGYLNAFLKTLESKESKGGQPIRDEGYFSEQEKYYFYIKLADLQSVYQSLSPITIFQYLDDLRVIGMLDELSFSLKLKNGAEIISNELSDGEIQTVFFNSIIELFKDLECIIMLDEPDAFLHPEWQSNLTKQLSSQNQKNHVIISSHCASTIAPAKHDNVTLFDISQTPIKSFRVNNSYAVQQLSGDLITLDRQSNILTIIERIRLDNKPVLFTEGFTDPIIIEHAWNKIKKTPIPFIPIYAFNCSYLRQLVQDEKIYNELGNKPVFGLFDIDEAYNEWNFITGSDEVIDIFKGKSKKITNRNGYVMLLPVPKHKDISPQVIKPGTTDELLCHHSRLSMELLFYGHKKTENNFHRQNLRGPGDEIVFKGDKKNFAEKIIPSLPPAAFEIFRPMFDFIESKIP